MMQQIPKESFSKKRLVVTNTGMHWKMTGAEENNSLISNGSTIDLSNDNSINTSVQQSRKKKKMRIKKL